MDIILNRKRLISLVGVLLLLGTFTRSWAQDNPPQPVNLLVLGVDVNGQGYPLVMVNAATATADTLATFASRPVCRPSITQDGRVLLYELYDDGIPYVYQINIVGRERTLLGDDEAIALNCPLIAPDGNAIVWNQPNPDGTASLVMTDASIGNVTTLQTHPSILDIQWTPGGGALVYQLINEAAIFPELVSLPRQGGAMPRTVFQASDGILLDYQWTSDGTGMLVAYATDSEVAVTLLTTPCVIGPGPRCDIEPLVTFPADTDIDLLRAYAPISRQMVMVVQQLTEAGTYDTDLWAINLAQADVALQLTNSPDVIESDAIWAPDETVLYFIGSRFDADSQMLRGAIYQLDMTQDQPAPTLVFASPVFSPSAFLHAYSPPPQG